MSKHTLTVKPGSEEPKLLNNHTNRAHALLSASGAHRWLHCTPSAKLEEAEGERPTSIFAKEGTLAHELSELYIKHDILNEIDDAQFDEAFSAIMSDDMAVTVNGTGDTVLMSNDNMVKILDNVNITF